VKGIEIADFWEMLTGDSLIGLAFVMVSNRNSSLMFEDDSLLGIKGNMFKF
jgi:hypothetical protein